MTKYWRNGHWRVTPSGDTCWVEGHFYSRSDWDRSSSISVVGQVSRSLASETFNAHCPVCGAPVFFYQNDFGAKVYFDSLGPPWPKHPCMSEERDASLSLGTIADTNSNNTSISPPRRATVRRPLMFSTWRRFYILKIISGKTLIFVTGKMVSGKVIYLTLDKSEFIPIKNGDILFLLGMMGEVTVSVFSIIKMESFEFKAEILGKARYKELARADFKKKKKKKKRSK